MINKRVLKFCKNKYVVTVVVFFVWVMFFDEITVSKWVKQKMNNKKIIEEIELLNKQSEDLEQRLKYKDNKDSIEKYARENFYMKRSNEVIYIFD
ncbi:MAG: septum formation initiator family protein [Prevotellaceae bacterium]|jgi:cell division protein FtsB|nr:septum formation initiator family protein [Prevotellaceae bacterium]